MSVRNLDYLFKPRSVALIGASKTPGSVGAVTARNLFNSGFDGPVMPVNPKHRAIEGVLAYPDVASLPVTPDLAVICTPPDTVPGLVGELAECGTKGVVVITAGFAESASQHGRDLQQAMLSAARPQLLRIAGPNCLGVMVPRLGLNATFSHLGARPGRLAFVTQSGAIVTSVVDWAHARGIGFSHLVSLGGMADVDFGDMLDYLANDPDTQAVLLYVEAVSHARKFMSAARAAARMKPVVVVKAGRHAEGARAAASHTGALAGSDAVYDAVFRRAGMLRVAGLEELFDAVEILAATRPPKGDSVAILTNGGGIGVLATDALIDEGGRLAELSDETLRRLDEVLPPTWSHGNPVDIIGDAPGSRYADAFGALCENRGVDAILVLNCPTGVASSKDAAQAIVGRAAQGGGRRAGPMVITNWVGDWSAREARQLFSANGVPTYATPAAAVRAFMYLVNYRRSQEALMETPPSVPEEFAPDTARAREAIRTALDEERSWLTEPEAKSVLSAYGIPVAETRVARDPESAMELAAELGVPVALKILSPDITHKSDVGGVALDLKNPKAVQETAAAMLERVARGQPDARITGFTLGPMVRRPHAYELILGVMADEQFGPVILFGQGGTAVEVIDDKALGLPPLNMRLARELMSRTRVHKLLQGYRGLPGADLDAIALALYRISQLVVDVAEAAELDVNPLLADRHGVVALDARIRVARSTRPGTDRLCIRPYPKELEEPVRLGDGRALLLRPIVPEDEPALQEAVARLTPEQRRLRFFVPKKTLSHVAAARFTQIDYDREMALILTEPGIPGRTPIYGVVNISADPDHERAEYAILVRNDVTGMGLGIMLMRRIIEYASKRGIGEIYGDVLRENRGMLKLCKVLGFTESRVPDEPEVVRVSLKLQGRCAEAAAERGRKADAVG
ncbi:MAG: bifunctional acetate--CoA ligase family protein/GNAT family N-acetyltransferase [Gammaproteobacteria bacterium]|nr:bifunctional acetate--CoA ligase family protein/GNAT family N-acetyltransferase [Gammaproteobacteria bacterium]NIR83544.1 bifunctional acetate--CoA ligase family protein/GNAT family N-acetyltransferase [Gammaproteobacteria bacterium]NIR91466.1 bifunctional acetate--CoA ligase family protein/GNAT family N-acetyltransferase [Gammaproteobacteria bacterium]NIU04706.1 bifunctional acetate--CoA ligase family protein/GNAT family N-acetyltransferase [Gammaproteobacteria bacterium]NIV51748.1 GNAT fam